MENLLLKKLQIKPGNSVSVVNAPEHGASIFGEITNNIVLHFRQLNNFDALILFIHNKAELELLLKQNHNLINTNIVCWILYPKKSSNIKTDLDLMRTWKDDFGPYNLTPCASASINDVWTGLRIKLANSVKSSGLANADLKNSSFSEYIDVVNKKILKLPNDLEEELLKNTLAKDFFNNLSYSNKKEYILWILTAKLEKTRSNRLDKAINRIKMGYKNPNEKK